MWRLFGMSGKVRITHFRKGLSGPLNAILSLSIINLKYHTVLLLNVEDVPQ